MIAGIPAVEREVRLKFHSQEGSQAVRFYDAEGLDWDWQCLVITTCVLEQTPVTYLLLRTDVQAEGRLEEELRAHGGYTLTCFACTILKKRGTSWPGYEPDMMAGA